MRSHEHHNEPHAPWSAQVELTEGCSRLCGFCGLNAIREGPGDYHFMSVMMAETTAMGLADLCPTARVEFAMHGEPLMNPDATRIFAIFRAYLPKAQLMVTTNGVRFRKKDTMKARCDELFAAGVDFVVLDTYEPERSALIVEARLAALDGLRVFDFYADLAPAGINVYGKSHGAKLRHSVVLMDDIGIRDGEHPSRVLLNHAGCNPQAPTPAQPLAKTCTNPFREVTVTWDGDVRICCMDWRGEHSMGNATDGLRAVWYGDSFNAARAHLHARDRTFMPCDLCNKNSGTRVGLLPTFDPPTDAQRALVPRRKTRLPKLNVIA